MGLSRAEVTKNLRKIRNLKLQVEKIDNRIEVLKSRAEYPGVQYSDLPKPPKDNNSNVFQKYMEQKEKLEIDKLDLENKIFELEKLFSNLEKLYYDILYAKYSKGCNKSSWKDIADQFGYSESVCRKYKTEAFKILEDF